MCSENLPLLFTALSFETKQGKQCLYALLYLHGASVPTGDLRYEFFTSSGNYINFSSSSSD